MPLLGGAEGGPPHSAHSGRATTLGSASTGAHGRIIPCERRVTNHETTLVPRRTGKRRHERVMPCEGSGAAYAAYLTSTLFPFAARSEIAITSGASGRAKWRQAPAPLHA
jgi:hypothetical protein